MKSINVAPTGILDKGFSETSDRTITVPQLGKPKLWKLNTSSSGWVGVKGDA